MPYVTTSAPGAALRADRARRTISGQVVPWGVFAQVSTGQVVAFARGSLQLSERAKLVIDHDPGRPVAVYVDSTDTETGLEATFRVPAGARGDEILAEAGEGLRDGFSVGADLGTFDERDGGALWVTAARGRHVALLSEPAFDSARVSSVVASQPTPPLIGAAMPTPALTATAASPEPPAEPEPEPTGPDPEVRLTVAGAASPVPAAPARVRDPYPYAQPHVLGGPSFVRDAWASMENPGSAEADRWRRAQLMATDPSVLRAGVARLAAAPADVAAATGTTGNVSDIVPPHIRPDLYVPIKAAKAPLWSALTKYSTPDFNPILVPRTLAETGLSGRPADEVTPIAPGTITTDTDTITPDEVEGAYMFSRKLLLGSNPQIDSIASDAMNRAWLADVEARAVTYFVGGANTHTAVSATYADAEGYLAALLAAFADMATGPFTPTDVIPAQKEYTALATAVDTTGRPLLPYGPRLNAPGESTAGYTSLIAQGVPLWPGRSMTANNSMILDQSADAAVAWATPIMSFRLEWTTDTTTGGNVKVLKLVKYSGVGFWSQYPQGVLMMTNTTPIAAGNGNGGAGEPAKAQGARK